MLQQQTEHAMRVQPGSREQPRQEQPPMQAHEAQVLARAQARQEHAQDAHRQAIEKPPGPLQTKSPRRLGRRRAAKVESQDHRQHGSAQWHLDVADEP